MNGKNNDFLEFYGKHNISPVEQDISEIQIHYKRREKLYRQLGMPKMLFKDKEVCEVGPGGGYNSLAFFEWGVKHLDLVEANPKGIQDMEELFEKQKIDKNRYTIYETVVERFDTDKKYDIVIAESFLQYLTNQQEVIDKLKSITKPGGIIVVTCSDDTCFYIEQIKRVIAHTLVADIESYDEKVEFLVNIFEPQLKKLRGVSRSAKSWVQDQLLNPVAVNGTSLSLIDAIHKFGNNTEYLSSSPRMFTDYSWYKDIWFDDNKSYEKQYSIKGASLLLANMEEEIILMPEKLEELNRIIKKSKSYAVACENNKNLDAISKIIEGNKKIQEILKGKSLILDKTLEEIGIALEELLTEKIQNYNMGDYPELFEAFGRTQQYISFII